MIEAVFVCARGFGECDSARAVCWIDRRPKPQWVTAPRATTAALVDSARWVTLTRLPVGFVATSAAL
jgi:hypothetical protein